MDWLPCEDGHAQERRLFPLVLSRIQPHQFEVQIAMCTLDVLMGIEQHQAHFIIREHQNLP